jgi:8-amino-7-oxononanoate synthase
VGLSKKKRGIPLQNPTVDSRSRDSHGALDAALSRELESLREIGLERSLRSIEGLPGPRMRVDGRSVLMLASANYLDLAGDPRVLAAAGEALARHGAAAGGSRLIAGNTALHEALERELADWLGFEAALLWSTGYMANLGVLTALAGAEDVILSDALNHASTIDACRLSGARTLVFRHNDVEDLERLARGCAGFRRRLIVVDGVYSMEGDTAPLARIAAVARAHDAVVVLDDTHGIGVLGAAGRGTAELEGVSPDLVVGNLGKALGSFGAFVACSERVRAALVNRSRSFIFTCALAPASVGAARAALAIARAEPWRRKALLERAEQLRAGLARAGFDTLAASTHVVPAVVGDNARTMELCERALARGVYAQGIRFPSVPAGTARLRFTPTCAHTAEEIAEVVELFRTLAA